MTSATGHVSRVIGRRLLPGGGQWASPGVFFSSIKHVSRVIGRRLLPGGGQWASPGVFFPSIKHVSRVMGRRLLPAGGQWAASSVVNTSADHAAAAPAIQEVPAATLQDGEEVILAIKPSGWFVILVSWPVITAAAAVGVASRLLHFSGPHEIVPLLSFAAICLRVVLACGYWAGLLYVLTNRRVMSIRGLARPDVHACPLRDVVRANVSPGVAEGVLGLGTIVFELRHEMHPELCWMSVAHVHEVHRTIDDAIRRAR